MTPTNENLQQAYMMLLNSKQYLRKAKEWKLKEDEMNELCKQILEIQNRVYELIHYFDEEE